MEFTKEELKIIFEALNHLDSNIRAGYVPKFYTIREIEVIEKKIKKELKNKK